MVDAVSTLISQSAAPRSQPQNTAAPVSAEPVQSASPDLVISNIRVDNLQNVAILEYRSAKTGDVLRQYPTQGQINAFKRAEQLQTEADQEGHHGVSSVSQPPQQQGGETQSVKAAPAPSAAPVAEAAAPAPSSGSAESTQSVVV